MGDIYKKKEKPIFVEIKTHKIVKVEAVKRDISMRKLVHDAVVGYLERHKIFNSNLIIRFLLEAYFSLI